MQTKILLIEDDEIILQNTIILLEEEGFCVSSAINGAKGLELAKKELPDLIVCDISMPELDGYEVLQELSKSQKTSMIPFIFLTAKVEAQDLRKGMNLGADDYIFKPFTGDQLLKAIETRLSKREQLKNTTETEEVPAEPADKKLTEDDSIFINLNDSPTLLKIKEIKFIQALNQYSQLSLSNNKTAMMRKSLTEWEKLLPDNIFLRIHRSCIINKHYIKKISKWSNYSYKIDLIDCDEEFVASKRYSAILRKTHQL